MLIADQLAIRTDDLQPANTPARHALAAVAVLIPAWRPEPCLVPLVDSLLDAGVGRLVLVDDGSGTEFAPLFAMLAERPQVVLLRHAVNLGKGRALKTGINFILMEHPACDAVVTADADGQHKAEDILRVALASRNLVPAPKHGPDFLLGVRAFSGDVPLRSRLGNSLTRLVFRFLTGIRLTDTQTGLRCFPRALLPELLRLEGERYEYEMTVLAHLCRTGPRPVEVPIETVYIANNRGSHFDPIRDSMRIYFVLLRFYASALLAAGIDLAGFAIAFAATGNTAFSVAAGRLSSLVNFTLNKRFVFHSRTSLSGSLLRYYVLVAGIAALSVLGIWTLTRHAHWNVYVAKLTVDTLLSLISFSMQRTFVFRRSQEAT